MRAMYVFNVALLVHRFGDEAARRLDTEAKRAFRARHHGRRGRIALDPEHARRLGVEERWQ
jgi:hypothetical protein